MAEKQIMVKIDHVSKEYRLGAIGGTTLREDLERFHAKIRKKEDPTLKIGQKTPEYGKRFMALKDISFEVEKGEAVGIIGHNGAGKSTLLKLLSRVTAPTKGSIGMNGRVASMLEVGTGFHPELTGRENIYMNGAILGMSRAEIGEKLDQIIAFSECGEFIDTPVKRYSSGMYVKLAFSVAAHLDSEIMIMDEVLAVGDMKFQQKCLGRMGEAANSEEKTILYELEYEQNYGTDITALYESAGATVLNYEYKDITINSQPLRIGGIYGYCLPDKYLETGEADPGECKFLWDFENTDRYKILLSHLPIAWLKNDGLEEWDIDCVFSGHLHGGQVILPGIGGVYAPDMGWFPGQLKGIFDSEDGKRHLVLSSGLGNTELVPRFNNIPEIACVELMPDGNLHKT